MNIEQRVRNYEPLCNKWYVKEIVHIQEKECVIKVIENALEETIAYIKIVSVFDISNDIVALENRVEKLKEVIGIYEDVHEEYVDYEQYLIEDEQGKVIGIDFVMVLDTYEEVDEHTMHLMSGKELYEQGLKYFDQQDYNEALKYFETGEKIEDSDCLCIIGYYYERGLVFEQNYEMCNKINIMGNICTLFKFLDINIFCEIINVLK